MIVRNEVIDPKNLEPAEKEALISALYSVHNEVFDGVSREEFARYVVNSPAQKTRIQLSYGQNGELAGYLAMHAFRPTLRGEECTVIRAEAGLRRAYRGNASTASFAISNLLQTKWDYRGPLYYLGCLVHPSSYTIFANNAPAVWPAPNVEIPNDLLELMMQLGEEFHLEMVDPAKPLVRKVGWVTRDTEAEKQYWQNCDLAGARYYLEQNPGYFQGHGLLTLLPLDGASMAKMILNTGTSRLKKSIQRTVGSVERKFVHRSLDAFTAEELLQSVEEITGIDLDAVRQQGLLGTRYPLSPRQTLFRAGDRADALYIVIEGSLFVFGDTPDGEIVIDQLGPNTMIGDMEMMTGQPRVTTVRAAIDTVLLRLSKEDLDKLLSVEPRLEAALWDHIHGRVFALLSRQVPALAKINRSQREQWFATTNSKMLKSRESLQVPPDSVIVASLGQFVVQNENGWMNLSAPALLKIDRESSLVASTNTNLAILPGTPEKAPAKNQ